MRVALVRHPKPDIAAGFCYGRLDLPLAKDADIPAIVARLGAFRPAAVWASTALRCRALAEALGRPRFDARLLELNFGDWEGMAWDDVPRASLDAWAADPSGFRPPGGETGAELVARVQSFARDLLGRGADAIVVAHGGPLRLLPALLQGQRPDVLAPGQGIGEVVWVDVDLRD